jgi:hypothetical protein
MLGLATGLLFVVLGVFLAGASRVALAHAGSAPTVYSDPVGDSVGESADITSVAISDSGGVVEVAVTATGFKVVAPATKTVLEVDLDTNGDGGAEYSFDTMLNGTDSSNGFWQWVDEEVGYQPMPPSLTMTYSAAADTYTFTFSPADVGDVTAFEFWAGSWTDIVPGSDWGDVTDLYSYTITPPVEPPVTPPVEPVTPTQVAPPTGTVEPRPITELPDGAMYLFADGQYHQISPAQFSAFGLSVQAIEYVGELYEPIGAPATDEQVQAMEAAYVQALTDLGVPTAPTATTTTTAATPPPTTATTPVEKPVINKPATVPAKPVAGRVFTVSFPVTSNLTGASLTSAKMICDPSVKGKVIKHFEQFKNGNATLRFTIPATAKGKTLKVHLTMVVGDQSTTRIATFLVH